MRRLHDETLRAMNIADVRVRLEQQGFEIEGSTPEACRDYIRSELAKWAKIVAAAGIKTESSR
ncbi:Tripartite tricarboxylate transporter family receptor [compost metagenome]